VLAIVLAAVAVRWEWGGDAGVNTTRRDHNHVRAWKTEGGSGDAPPRTPSRRGVKVAALLWSVNFQKKMSVDRGGDMKGRTGRHPQVCVRAQRGWPLPSTTIVDPNGKTVAQCVCSGGAGVVQVGADRGGEVEVCVVLYTRPSPTGKRRLRDFTPSPTFSEARAQNPHNEMGGGSCIRTPRFIFLLHTLCAKGLHVRSLLLDRVASPMGWVREGRQC